LPRCTEVAVYFVVAQALTNASNKTMQG
jgi:hypothetical protein